MVATPPGKKPEEPVEHVDKVLEWRKEYLVRAGYDEEEATLLAEHPGVVDLHRAEALLEQGCPSTTALLILL